MKRIQRLVGVVATTFCATSASAAIDGGAAVVLLRKSCTENGNVVDNCFTSMSTLTTWIWNARRPGQTSGRTPLMVDVGPGLFSGSFTCDGRADDDASASGVQHRGHVTIRGAGVNNSVLEDDQAVVTLACENLVFENMTFRSTSPEQGVSNVGGNTTWNHVELSARNYAWNDGIGDGECSTREIPKGKHIWNNSRILATSGQWGTIAYYNHCDDALFLGSEINAEATSNALGVKRNVAIFTYGGNIRIYGGAIRVLSGPGIVADGALGASVAVLTARPEAEVHIHGTGIDMISADPNPLRAFYMGQGGMIHANGAAYMMRTGAGARVERIYLEPESPMPMVMAPYLWEPMATPPNIYSLTGQDTVVVTQTADEKPHTLVYAESCATRWFDNNTNDCYVAP